MVNESAAGVKGLGLQGLDHPHGVREDAGTEGTLMMPEDFTAELSDRLRCKGVDFQPAELQTFLADARPESSTAPAVEALVEQFIETHQAHMQKVRMIQAAPQRFAEGLSIAVWAGVGAAGAVAYYIRTWDATAFQAGGFAFAWQLFTGAIVLAITGTSVFGVVRAVQGAVILARYKDRPGG